MIESLLLSLKWVIDFNWMNCCYCGIIVLSWLFSIHPPPPLWTIIFHVFDRSRVNLIKKNNSFRRGFIVE